MIKIGENHFHVTFFPPPKPKLTRGEKFQLLFGQSRKSSQTHGIPQKGKGDEVDGGGFEQVS